MESETLTREQFDALRAQFVAGQRNLTLNDYARRIAGNWLCLSQADVEGIEYILRPMEIEAEECGYQRGKSEANIVTLTEEQLIAYAEGEPVKHGFSHSIINEHTNTQVDVCMCNGGWSHDLFTEAEGINQHLRDEWAKEQPIPCDWEDLKGLEGRALRERVASRAQVWRHLLNVLRDEQDLYDSHLDSADAEILIGLIQSKSQACEVEADRLWSIHLDSFEPLLDEPDGAAKIVAALGANYLPVIVDRAAAKRARAAETVTTINLNDNGILEPGHRAWLDLKGRQD